MAFRTAGRDAFIEAFKKSRPCLLEPIMTVEIEIPGEFQGPVVGDLNSRRGIIMGTEARNNYTVVRAEVPLANMFGYATVIRGMTRGTGTFTMEMSRYARVPAKISELILEQHREQKEQPARK
jgi:elongation factor G